MGCSVPTALGRVIIPGDGDGCVRRAVGCVRTSVPSAPVRTRSARCGSGTTLHLCLL